MPHACRELIVATGGRASLEVSSLSPVGTARTDSRQVHPGDCFWALKGSSQDGHDFVGEAIRRGASLAVVEVDRPVFDGVPRVVVPDTLKALADYARWHRQSLEALVIGVTGSVGKTTTRTMLHAMLGSRFRGAQSPGNFNNHVGVPLSLLAVDREDEYAVIEMGASGVGEIARLADIARPEAAVMTTVGPAHLERFGSIEAIEQAKGELVEAVPASGFVVLNGDDPRVRAMSHRAACRTITVGERADNHVRAERVFVGNECLRFSVDGDEYEVSATGRHFLTAALACVAVGREIGLSPAEIATGLRRFELVGGRCRPLAIGDCTVIDDTYNSSPRAASAACDMLRDWQCKGRKWLVLGDMLELGREAPRFHRELGEQAAATGADGIIALGEFATDIADGARSHGMSRGQLAVCRDLATVMLHLECWLAAGDLVLVKGSRGMRMERVVEELRRRAAIEREPQARAA
jgi:UDP-N-acetylmuramoyl-tripeptide--D-alanyl-D-alanine ligase